MLSSGLASHIASSHVAGLYFPSLTTQTCLARLLPIPVTSRKAPKPFKAAETRRKHNVYWTNRNGSHEPQRGNRTPIAAVVHGLVFRPNDLPQQSTRSDYWGA